MNEAMHISSGGCHCGNLKTRFASPTAPGDSPVRACQCSFCRKHGVRAVADAKGQAEIRVRDPKNLIRYQFGHRAADFLVCGICGVYVAAVMDDDSGDSQGTFATMIVNTFDNHADFTNSAEPVDYAGEDLTGRRQRRRDKWTPAEIRSAP